MEEKNNIRKYKDDDFKINCIYKEDGKTLPKLFKDLEFTKIESNKSA